MRIKRFCNLCGSEYWTGNGKAKYCSDECRKEAARRRQAKWRDEHPEYHKNYFAEHPDAKERFRENHPNYGRDRSRVLRESIEYKRLCEVCGKEYLTYFPQAKTCSGECSSILRNRNRVKRIKSRYKIQAVFDAYNGICQICGEPCDWTDAKVVNGVKCMGNKYPTIDHIVPVSKNGEDKIENIQLAHMICNAKKGAV